MHTATDLKNKLIDHMMGFDLNKLRMEELSGYAEIVSKINAMDKADYFDTMIKLIGNNGFGFNGIDTKISDPSYEKEMKENA